MMKQREIHLNLKLFILKCFAHEKIAAVTYHQHCDVQHLCDRAAAKSLQYLSRRNNIPYWEPVL